MRHYRKDIYDINVYKKYDKLSDEIREMLAEDEKIAKYQQFIKDIEKDILDISGDVLDLRARHDITPSEYDLLEALLLMRSCALNNLFETHCTDEEVRRFTAINNQLYDMTKRMYERTRMLNEFIKTMPLHEKDDDVEVEANLKFWDDGAISVLELEDDEFYGSDFARMIELIAMVDSDHTHLDEIGRLIG